MTRNHASLGSMCWLVLLVAGCGRIPEPLADSVQTKQGVALVLNGEADRKPFFLAPVIYRMGLYLSSKSHDADEILFSHEPKRMDLHALKSSDAGPLRERYWERFKKMHPSPSAELSRDFGAMLGAIPNMSEGDVLSWEYEGGKNVLAVNGKQVFECSTPEVFLSLLRMYIGPAPIDDGMKNKLLGRG